MADMQLGSSPLGLVMYAKNNTLVSIGVYDYGSASNLLKSLFSRQDDDHNYEFDYDVENSSTYEMSTESIIKYSEQNPLMKLKYADFAYLKNLGVYPNNRLMIARRFPGPVGDDLVNFDGSRSPTSAPLATLVSWVPDNQDFFDVTFGENWEDADTSFEDILNDASENRDLLSGDNEGKRLGTFLSKGLNAIPLRGWSEGLQYQIFREFGLTDRDASDLPTGNPNLIRSAKQRKIAPKKGRFEGMTTKVSVKMVVEYEQKFISNVDPTGVYYDIVANALNFGTSNSKFMFNREALNPGRFTQFLDNLGSGDPKRVMQALRDFLDSLKKALIAVKDAIIAVWTEIKQTAEKAAGAFNKAAAEGKPLEGAKDAAGVVVEEVKNSLFNVLVDVVAGVISKYKVRLIGVLNSLTGAASTPWHVTIGNPRRPIFSSGDMLVEDVTVTFGKLLAFNDLPSSVKIEFTLTNARALGRQEIFRKLNCGRGRSYKQIRLDLVSTDATIEELESKKENPTDTKGNAAVAASNNLGPKLTNAGGPFGSLVGLVSGVFGTGSSFSFIGLTGPMLEKLNKSTDTFIVNAGSGLNVRKTPDKNGAVLGKLADKTEVKGVPGAGKWTLIKAPTGMIGYVHSSFLKKKQ